MADSANSSGGGAGMGMIVGALVVIVAILAAVMVFGGGSLFGSSHKTLDVNVSAPQLSGGSGK